MPRLTVVPSSQDTLAESTPPASDVIQDIEWIARTLRVNTNTARTLCRQGKVGGVFRVGKAWLLHTDKFLEWCAAQCKEPSAEAAPVIPSIVGRNRIEPKFAELLRGRRIANGRVTGMSETGVYKRENSRHWQLRWTDRATGTEIRRSSGTEDFEEAKRRLESFKSGTALTMQATITRFFETHPMRPKTRDCYITSLKAWLPFVQDIMIGQLDRPLIRQFVAARIGNVKNGTIRNDLAMMSSVMAFASMLPGGPTINPVLSYNKRHLKLPEARVRYLPPGGLDALLSVIERDECKLIVLFAAEAGLRCSEILNLRTWQADPRRREVILRGGEETKNGKGRKIPMTNRLTRAIIKHWRKHKPAPGGYLIANPDTGRPFYGLSKWWSQARERAGLTDWHFHDLRHHFASSYVQRGGRLQPLAELLGHSTTQMTQRYAHLAPGDAAREFRRIAGRA